MRGPYQGTWEPNILPTVVTAPDALVYINGDNGLIGCPDCHRRVELSKYLTAIQIDLNVDSCPGSASLTFSVPRHAVDSLFYDGAPIILPMMEIEIWGKGYFLVDGVPQYYPIFWGLTTEVSEAYSGGEQTITVQCSDILKWWDLCKMNIAPAYPAGVTTQNGMSVFGNVFFGKNPYDIMWSLAQFSFGDVVIGTGSCVSTIKEKSQLAVFKNVLGDTMRYWAHRFRRIRSNLLLYGVNGIAVPGTQLWQKYRTWRNATKKGKKPKKTEPYPIASQAVQMANGGSQGLQLVYDPTGKNVAAFKLPITQVNVDIWQSEFQSKLELANACKEAIGFEFYMDVTGDIVFKPPFFNLDVLGNKPVSWIQDIDVIDWDFSESEAEVVTQLQIQGNYGGKYDYGLSEETTPFTTITDYHLLRRYGWRTQQLNSEFLGGGNNAFYYGLDMLDKLNAKRFRGSVTIPFRPELRLGFPIYVAPKDQMWYVSGISHSVQFGGRATTTLTLTAKRSKYIAIKGLSSLSVNSAVNSDSKVQDIVNNGYFSLTVGTGGTIPPESDKPNPDDDPLILRHPKTGRLVGYPNVTMVYTRPFAPTADQKNNLGGKKTRLTKEQKDQALKNIDMEVEDEEDLLASSGNPEIAELREKHKNNRYSFGMTSAGVYVYAHDKGKVVQQLLLLPKGSVEVTPKNESFGGKNSSILIRPVSDERGFEVIGHNRYGRGVTIKDGYMVKQPGGPGASIVAYQQPISGDLAGVLESASRGLVKIKTSYQPPAQTISTMVPDDEQTAGRVPNLQGESQTGTPEAQFVKVATKGSPTDKGIDTYPEVSQLSKARMLTELTLKEEGAGSSDPNVPCLCGRTDLAFMAVGYQVRTINASVAELTLGPEGKDENRQPVEPKAILPKVEEYLFALYDTLDKAHMAVEKELRGDYASYSPAGGIQIQSVAPEDTSGLAPPFSQPDRALLGDTSAAAQQGSSATAHLVDGWKNLSDNLTKGAKRDLLNRQIAQDKSLLADYQAELEKFYTQVVIDPVTGQMNWAPGVVPTGNPMDIQRNLRESIGETQQDLAEKQLELQSL